VTSALMRMAIMFTTEGVRMRRMRRMQSSVCDTRHIGYPDLGVASFCGIIEYSLQGGLQGVWIGRGKIPGILIIYPHCVPSESGSEETFARLQSTSLELVSPSHHSFVRISDEYSFMELCFPGSITPLPLLMFPRCLSITSGARPSRVTRYANEGLPMAHLPAVIFTVAERSCRWRTWPGHRTTRSPSGSSSQTSPLPLLPPLLQRCPRAYNGHSKPSTHQPHQQEQVKKPQDPPSKPVA